MFISMRFLKVREVKNKRKKVVFLLENECVRFLAACSPAFHSFR
jgi:hypothetical protein